MEVIDRALADGVRTLSENDSRSVLAAYGIPLVPSAFTGSETEAVQRAYEMGFPVVLKGTGAKLAHKTERDVVRLDLRNRDEVARAYREIAARAAGLLEGVLVQKLIESEREFVAGMSRDPQFGPCVMFGLGGIFTEALHDVVFRVAPLSRDDTSQMMDGFKAASLLGPFRGKPAANREALSALLRNLGRLGLEQERVAEVDINPILLDGGKPVAVDALVALRI